MKNTSTILVSIAIGFILVCGMRLLQNGSDGWTNETRYLMDLGWVALIAALLTRFLVE